jgi:hypothetical protein
MNSKNSNEGKKISRRGFLAGVGAAGIAAAGGASLLSSAHAGNVKFPWGYQKIDPLRAGKVAYEGWYKNFCCYGAASGILRPLQEDIGEPYTLFPLEATIWGHGGAVGWGTLCGSLNGAGMVTSLLAGEDAEHIINEVIAWYTKTNLPLYKPSTPRAEIRQTSRSNSALCHVSVGKWMRKEGATFESPPRWERCARITADVAMKTIQLLNDWTDGRYKITRRSQVKMYQMPTDNNCIQCHGSNIPGVPEEG